MALDESTDHLEQLESNGVNAFIDSKVLKHIEQHGDIRIDYVTRPEGSGYMISIGNPDCSACGCKGC
ncbi:MAG: hypothetical protein KAW91_05145 [candidate division Zixibacteria bacterium]|nr:hypothetical protein [candidate division Zixibacteria bacterium]MCK4606147.1 hypothetical protein [candidate division Zixibacteria bacterium]